MAIPPFGSPPPYSKGNFLVKQGNLEVEPSASDSASLGSELVTSNAFSNATYWTVGTGWVGGASSATGTAATGALVATAANVPNAAIGSYYRVAFRITSATAGSLTLNYGSGTYTWPVGNTGFGIFVVLVPTAAAGFQIQGNTFSGTIQGISIKLVTPANAPFVIDDSTGAVGIEARSCGAANSDIALGTNALRSSQNIPRCVAIGSGALGKNISGTGQNAAVGASALQECASGANNTAYGTFALQLCVNGQQNVALGGQALQNLVNASSNVAIGASSGGAVTGGGSNIFIGAGSGGNVTTGASNIIIGATLSAPTPTTSFYVSIGNLYYGSTSTGFAGIGIAAPNSVLQTNGAVATPIVAKSSAYTIVAGDSTILATGTTTITLPTAVGVTGRQYTIKKTDAGGTNVTVAGNGVELIDGANTVVLNTQYEAVTVQSDGTQWWVIGQVATVIL